MGERIREMLWVGLVAVLATVASTIWAGTQISEVVGQRPPGDVPIGARDRDARLSKYAQLTRWGLPGRDRILKGDMEYLLGTPGMTRNPVWCVEYLERDTVLGDADRDDDEWQSEDTVEVEWRALDNDYRGSGYDRGHLAASANHCHDERAQASTFTLANTMPQTPELNRGLWRELEERIRDRVKQGEVVWVVTIPVWRTDADDNICVRTIGSGVWVPTHCAKACLWFPDRKRSGDARQASVECWMFPNDHKVEGQIDNYTTTCDEIERLVGLNLFSGLPDEIERKLER